MNKGFTLIEVIIYIGLFGILMVGAVVAAFQLFESGGHNQAAVEIQEEGTFLSRKITWALTSATAVSAPTPTQLLVTKLTGPDFVVGQNPILIDGSDGKTLTLSRAGGAPAVLNSVAFTVSGVNFSVVPASGGFATSTQASFSVNGVPFSFKEYLRQ